MSNTDDGDSSSMSTPLKFVSGDRRLRRHNKSRTGCYRCKVKRIKCSETKPKCHHCLKNAAQCVYPDLQKDSPPFQISLVQNNHLGFSLHDLRLFHDFMTASHPHLPLETEKAWLNDIPVIAQQHEFLMHGILALGAAHLHTRTDLALKESVDRHRSLAIQGLNSMELVKVNKGDDDSVEHGTRLSALLATCYLLSFASSYMGDSLNHFLVLVRGCSSLTQEIVRDGHKSPLLPWNSRSATAEPHLEVMRRRLQNAPLLSEDELADAKISLALAENNCIFLPFQWRIFQSMKATLASAEEPFEAYSHFIEIWNEFTSMAPADFATFTDNTNMTSVILQAHFLGIEALLKPWLLTEMENGISRDGYHALPPSATLAGPAGELVRWPLRILEQQRGELKKEG